MEDYRESINNPHTGLDVETVLMRSGKKNKTLIVIPQNGLGDRIKLLASSLYLCEHEDINLVVMWAKNCNGYSSCCSIFDIFQSPQIKKIDNPRMNENEYISTNPKEDLKKLGRIWVTGFDFFKSTFSNQDAMNFLYTFILNTISPKVVAPLAKYNTKDCIGVHVRRGDLCENNEQQYRIVPEEDFFAKIDKNQKVFLCTEDERVRTSFLKNYGKNLIVVEDGKLDRTSVEGAITALVEILLLSRCKKIFCSPSGFSQIAGMFSNTEREVVYPSRIQCYFTPPEDTIESGLKNKCLYCGEAGERYKTERTCSATYEEARRKQMQLRGSIVGERGLFWGTTSRKFDRILDRVILASDTHENYLPFWEYAAKAWNKIGVKPTLFLVENSDERVDIDESLGDVYRIRLPDQSMHSAFVSQCVRLLAPCLFPDENITLADIDMIPLSKRYFFNNLSQGDEDSFIEYRNDFQADSQMMAICWNVARGSTWSEIFDIKANVDNYQEVFLERLRQWNPNGYRPIYEELVASWFTDQTMLYTHVNNWSKNNSDRHVKLIDSQTGFCRLDHRADGFSADLHDHYTDFCPRRPLQHNVDNIKHVLELYEII